MPRPLRADEAGGVYHALNRGNARAAIFRKEADYEAFERSKTMSPDPLEFLRLLERGEAKPFITLPGRSTATARIRWKQ